VAAKEQKNKNCLQNAQKQAKSNIDCISFFSGGGTLGPLFEGMGKVSMKDGGGEVVERAG
jgi:hypothetical protein